MGTDVVKPLFFNVNTAYIKELTVYKKDFTC